MSCKQRLFLSLAALAAFTLSACLDSSDSSADMNETGPQADTSGYSGLIAWSDVNIIIGGRELRVWDLETSEFILQLSDDDPDHHVSRMNTELSGNGATLIYVQSHRFEGDRSQLGQLHAHALDGDSIETLPREDATGGFLRDALSPSINADGSTVAFAEHRYEIGEGDEVGDPIHQNIAIWHPGQDNAQVIAEDLSDIVCPRIDDGGARVVAAVGESLYHMPVGGGAMTEIPLDENVVSELLPTVDAANRCWIQLSGDGQRVAFTGRSHDGDTTGIFITDVESGATQQVGLNIEEEIVPYLSSWDMSRNGQRMFIQTYSEIDDGANVARRSYTVELNNPEQATQIHERTVVAGLPIVAISRNGETLAHREQSPDTGEGTLQIWRFNGDDPRIIEDSESMIAAPSFTF
ncbi:hypothetical protein J2T60_000598 [Natronospira proteinivora]|uniref:WD40 repeat protein n=1 Tax=Natronospira proteinivora TaxID=1807133 RepID=A0ABT1G8G2_9GAMM|nr:hypothetical protein [Natronospira proteinivora]MCP1726633.1 hypothetical protein [Natronospira proteinivora]